jgi:hypothetical protein
MAEQTPFRFYNPDGTVELEFTDEQVDRFVAFILGTESSYDSSK